MNDPLAPAAEVDLDTLYGHPPGYLNAIQWLFLSESTVAEFLTAANKIEAELRAQAQTPEAASATGVAGVEPPREAARAPLPVAQRSCRFRAMRHRTVQGTRCRS